MIIDFLLIIYINLKQIFTQGLPSCFFFLHLKKYLHSFTFEYLAATMVTMDGWAAQFSGGKVAPSIVKKQQ